VLDTLGIGHYPGTAMPGQVGNFALAAHRVTSGKPFNAIADLQVGDALVVETAVGWYIYRVTETTIVLPTETSVIAPVPGQPGVEPTSAMITLTTCHPMFSTRQRFVVHGVLESTSPRSDGRPGILTDGAGIATGSEG
jgi:sortase A